MTIFFSEHSKWERDFINNELLSGIDLTGKNVMVINHATPIEEVRRLVAELDPYIVFHLSDESGERPEWLHLFGCAMFVFRQYNHAHYAYPQNSIQLPLGYASGYTNNPTRCKPLIERMYKAAFIGELKSDRYEMFDAFERNFNKDELFLKATINVWELPRLQFSPNATSEVYGDSVFVPIGRGNQSLDCFRLYEAIVSGSIPVIVGDINEINQTFYYGGHMPSFIYATNWQEACVVCKNLLKHQSHVLSSIQNYNMEWWRTKIHYIRNTIDSS